MRNRLVGLLAIFGLAAASVVAPEFDSYANATDTNQKQEQNTSKEKDADSDSDENDADYYSPYAGANEVTTPLKADGAAAPQPKNLNPKQKPVAGSLKKDDFKTVETPTEYGSEGRKDSESLAEEKTSVSGKALTQQLVSAKIDKPIMVVGATWKEDPSAGKVTVTYRSYQDSKWSAWEDLEVNGEGGPNGILGTEALPVKGAEKVEVAVRTANGKQLENLKLSLVDPGESAADAAPEIQPDSPENRAAINEGGLTIYSRADWGANESLMKWKPVYSHFKAATVHHSAGGSGTKPSDIPGIIRGIYRYHAVSLGWGDIGYHVIVDKWGRAWEGRAGGLKKMPIGAHAYGGNRLAFGVSVLGNYEEEQPTSASVETVINVIAWKMHVLKIDPSANVYFPHAEKGARTLPAVNAHRDIGRTACPGRYLYNKMYYIRSEVIKRVARFGIGNPDNPVVMKSGQWEKDSKGTWWRSSDGSWVSSAFFKVDGKLYYANSEGYVAKGWFTYSGDWFYSHSSGQVAISEWVVDSGKRYYLDKKGRMLKSGWQIIDGKWYYLDGSGAAKQGWLDEYGKRYYLSAPNGVMLLGFNKVEGKYYYFNGSGQMQKGWIKFDKQSRYFSTSDGSMQTGWLTYEGQRYYLDPSTGFIATGARTIDGKAYFFDAAGKVREGWMKDGGAWYFYKAGYKQTGWLDEGGHRYYLKSDGKMASGWLSLDGIWYYLNGSGQMQKGWQKVGGTWYYLYGDGKMATGWVKQGGSWYYLYGSGAMATGWAKEGNTWYYLYGSGAMATGWVKQGGSWYYLYGSGAMATGWVKQGGTWYYLYSWGGMATGWIKLGGTWYYLNGSGAMADSSRYIGGTWNRFNSSGAWLGY